MSQSCGEALNVGCAVRTGFGAHGAPYISFFINDSGVGRQSLADKWKAKTNINS